MSDGLLALRVMVSTLRGARQGVPALAAALAKHHANATFFFNFGPDPSGRALLKGETFGFSSRKTALRTYGATGIFPGLLTPAPTLSDEAADVIRTTHDAGFELGVQSWDYVSWVQHLARAPNTWIEDEMAYAHEAYVRVLGHAPAALATPHWLAHRHQLRHAQQMGYTVSSVSRGTHPYVPIINGEPIGLAEVPTTLPTSGELLASGKATERTWVAELLQRTAHPRMNQVMTVYAEADGLAGASQVDSLLAGWRAQGFTICAVGTLAAHFDAPALPRVALDLPTRSTGSSSSTQQGKPYFSS